MRSEARPKPARPTSASPRFCEDMTCCKPGRVDVGLSCDRPTQQCCAWHHIRLVVRHRGDAMLVRFAEHLLAVCGWTLGEVFFAFDAAGESSSLAVVCARHWRARSSATDRAAYRAEVCAATSAEFVAVFDVLCEAELV